MEYSMDRSKRQYVNEFKELLRKANIEHQKTPAAMMERHVDVDITQDVADDIISNVSDQLESEINNRVEDISSNTEITANELRELRGILNVKGNSGEVKIEALKVESEHWKKESEKEEANGNAVKAKLYDAIREVAELKADQIRLNLKQQPETNTVIDMIKEETKTNDLTRFERFKKWARENIVGLSALAISVPGVITTVVMGARNAAKRGGKALKKFAKSVYNTGKKLGPLLSALGTLLSKMILLGGQGLMWLSKNLWILALAISYFIYNEYKA